MTTTTASARGRAALVRGKQTERDVAKAARPWWPDARRSRDNGSAVTADTGDLAGMNDTHLFWSVKADKQIKYPGTFAAWMDEARTKAGGRTPILIERRDGTANPLHWWAHLWLSDLIAISSASPDGPIGLLEHGIPVRLRVGHLYGLLAARGLTDVVPEGAS